MEKRIRVLRQLSRIFFVMVSASLVAGILGFALIAVWYVPYASS